MKIIFSHYGMKDGGDANGFTRSFNLSAGLVSLGNDVILITTLKNGFAFPYEYEIREGVKIYAFPEILSKRFRKGGFGLLSLFLKIIFVAFTPADIVHSDTGHRPSSGLPCVIHRFIYRSIYFSEWWEFFGRGGIYDDMPKWYKNSVGLWDLCFEEYNRKIASACIPISNFLSKRASKIGIKKENILVLNAGSDVRNINFYPINQQKKKFDIDNKTFVIGIIGLNDEEFKNNLMLIKAIKELKNKQKILLIATGSLSNSLREKYDVDEFLRLYDWLKYADFTKLLSCVDLFSLIQKENIRNKSRFPNKFGDYIAAGRPVIMNNVGDLKKYSELYAGFFYITKRNYTDILTNLINAINDWKNNRNNYQKIRNIAEKNSWFKKAELLNNFYSSFKK